MSKTLFEEALRQLKKAVILSLGIVCFIGMFWMIIEHAYSGFVPALCMRICGMIITIFLTAYLFRFIRNKSGCDFYYQVPWMKQKIALSYLAAVAVLVFIFVSVMYLAAGIFAAVWRTDYMSSPAVVVSEYLFSLSACIYILGVVFFSISLSGNMTSVIFIALMVIIIPKAFFNIWYTAVYGNIPHLLKWTTAYESSAKVLIKQYNMIWKTVQDLVNSAALYSGESFITAGYSSAVGLLYLFLGIQIWKKRGAEAAGNPAMNEKVQAVLRMLPAAFGSFFILTAIFSAKANWNIWPEKITGEHLVYLALGLIGYLFCAALIYVYEMLTTRKLWAGKNYFISKFLRWAGFLAGLDILFFTSVFIAHRQVWYETPDVSEINSIQILNRTHMPDYAREMLSEIYLEEDEIKELFAEGLKDTIESADKGNFFDYRFNDGVYEVVFHKNFQSIARYVYLDEQKEKEFAELLKQNGAWDAVCSHLPEITRDYSAKIEGIEEEGITERVYRTFREELKNSSLTDLCVNRDNIMFCIDILEESKDGNAKLLYSAPVSLNYVQTIEVFRKFVNERNDSPAEAFCRDMEAGVFNGELAVKIWIFDEDKYKQEGNTESFSKNMIWDADDSLEFCRALKRLEKELSKESEDKGIGWIGIQNYGGTDGDTVRLYRLTEKNLDLYQQVIEYGKRAREEYSQNR